LSPQETLGGSTFFSKSGFLEIFFRMKVSGSSLVFTLTCEREKWEKLIPAVFIHDNVTTFDTIIQRVIEKQRKATRLNKLSVFNLVFDADMDYKPPDIPPDLKIHIFHSSPEDCELRLPASVVKACQKLKMSFE